MPPPLDWAGLVSVRHIAAYVILRLQVSLALPAYSYLWLAIQTYAIVSTSNDSPLLQLVS